MVEFNLDGQGYFSFLELNCTEDFVKVIKREISNRFEIISVEIEEKPEYNLVVTTVYMVDVIGSISVHVENLHVDYESKKSSMAKYAFESNKRSNYTSRHLPRYMIDKFKSLGVL